MRFVYLLLSQKMEMVSPVESARPSFRAEVSLPDEGWPEASWVKTSGAGSPVLQVLWCDLAEDEKARLVVEGWQPGDPAYVEVQPGMAVTGAGVEVIFDEGGSSDRESVGV